MYKMSTQFISVNELNDTTCLNNMNFIIIQWNTSTAVDLKLISSHFYTCLFQMNLKGNTTNSLDVVD